MTLCAAAWLALGCATEDAVSVVDDAGGDDAKVEPLPDDDDADLPDDDAGTLSFDDVEEADDAGVDEDVPTADDVPAVMDAGARFDSGVGVDSGVRADTGGRVDARPPACTPRTYRLRHLQSSQQRTDTEARRRSSIDAAFNAGAHTISWTEIENLSDVRYIQARAGWTTFWPSGRPELVARNAVPVSWRSDTFRLVRGQSYFASEGRAGVSPSRWVTRVWLRHVASGAVLSRVAHHSVSGVDGAGEAPVAWRREMHARDIAKFREVMLLDTVPVVGSGDFNTVRLRSLLGSGFAYDVPSSGGSHGARLIDWIVRRPNAQQRLVDVVFVTVGASDHRGVRATYDFTPPCR